MKLSRPLRGAIGFAVGLALWLGLGELYHPIVARATEQLFQLREHPNVTQLKPAGSSVILDRADFDRRSPRPQIPVRDLTFNVILLLTLLAASGPPLTLAHGGRWAGALFALFVVHVAALTAKVMTFYVLKLGAWSRVHYGSIARDFWSGADHFYRFVGIYAFAFAIWWIARGDESAETEAVPRPAPKPARRRSRKR
ncbi:MAG: hypothetical protein HYU52_14010 [Acidobacteria bacterium]|nr:hypothetical protein [Acidobacteriota bacterium]